MKIFATINASVAFPGGNVPGENGIWLSLPDSAMMRSGKRFFIPDFDSRYMAYPAVALKIDRLGKTVAEKFAHRYISEITAGFLVVACGIMDRCRELSLPWSEAVVFDNSCWIGEGIGAGEDNPFGGAFAMKTEILNGSETESIEFSDPFGNAAIGLDPAKALSAVSDRNTVKIGDMFLMLLPGEGIPLREGMKIETTINGVKVFTTAVK